MNGPRQATANTLPSAETNSCTMLPAEVLISCRVYACPAVVFMLAFIFAWSAWTELRSPPNAAKADTQSPKATRAIPVNFAHPDMRPISYRLELEIVIRLTFDCRRWGRPLCCT